MASIVKLGKGKQPPRAIDFSISKKRHRIRIGKVSLAEAREFKRGIEKLLVARSLNQPIDNATAQWLAGVEIEIRDRMAKFGLCRTFQTTLTFEQLIADYLRRKSTELKPGSIKRIEDTVRLLKDHFMPGLLIDRITPAMAADWRIKLIKQLPSEASVRTAVRNAKAIFNDAIKNEITSKNPFRNLPSGSVAAEKGRYITPDETQRLIDAAPDWRWRALIGLMRYAGLRCCSETHSVSWEDVDWERHTLTIKAPKTGKTRIAPIRPEMMELLNDAWDMAPDNATSIVDLPANNRHRKMRAIIKVAKVEPWGDLFQHLRRCCRTQWLNEGHPPHAVSRWMGHGHKVGDEHYTMLTDDVIDRATGLNQKSASKSASLCSGIGRNVAESRNQIENVSGQQSPENTGNAVFKEVVRGGIEPPTHGFSIHCSTN